MFSLSPAIRGCFFFVLAVWHNQMNMNASCKLTTALYALFHLHDLPNKTVLFHISENGDVSVYVQRTSHKGAPHARSKGTGYRNQIHA